MDQKQVFRTKPDMRHVLLHSRYERSNKIERIGSVLNYPNHKSLENLMVCVDTYYRRQDQQRIIIIKILEMTQNFALTEKDDL